MSEQSDLDDLRVKNAELWALSNEMSVLLERERMQTAHLRRKVRHLEGVISSTEAAWKAEVIDEVYRQVRADVRGDLVVALSEYLGNGDL